MSIVEDLRQAAAPWAETEEAALLYDAADEIEGYRSTVFVLTRMVEALRNKQERGKPSGPLGITELKARLSELFGEVDASEDEDQLAGIMEGYKLVIRQAEHDLRDWIEGPYGEPGRGLWARVETARERVHATR